MNQAFRNCNYIINIFERTGSFQSQKGNLFLGGLNALGDPSFKQQLGVDCVLSVLGKEAYNSNKIESKIKEYEINHHKWLQNEQGESIYPLFEEGHAYLKEQLSGTNVLVHCQMGVSRSSTIVIAFLMKELKMSFQEAKAYVKSRREIINQNQVFIKDLLKYDKQLHEDRSKWT